MINTTGRRKTSIARLYMSNGKGKITVNKKDYKEHFPTAVLQQIINQPFEVIEATGKYDVKITVHGGGTTGQAGAIQLAIAKALCEDNEENRPSLRAKGLLTRDSRMVERKKPGLVKARKKTQYSKR